MITHYISIPIFLEQVIFLRLPADLHPPTNPSLSCALIWKTSGTVIAPGQDFTVTADAYDAAGLWKVGFTFNGNYKMMTTGPWYVGIVLC